MAFFVNSIWDGYLFLIWPCREASLNQPSNANRSKKHEKGVEQTTKKKKQPQPSSHSDIKPCFFPQCSNDARKCSNELDNEKSKRNECNFKLLVYFRFDVFFHIHMHNFMKILCASLFANQIFMFCFCLCALPIVFSVDDIRSQLFRLRQRKYSSVVYLENSSKKYLLFHPFLSFPIDFTGVIWFGNI